MRERATDGARFCACGGSLQAACMACGRPATPKEPLCGERHKAAISGQRRQTPGDPDSGERRIVTVLVACLEGEGQEAADPQGDPELADRRFRAALKVARQVGDSAGVAPALGNLGEADLAREAPAEALAYQDSGLAQVLAASHQEYEYEIRHHRGRALLELQEETAAQAEFTLAREQAAPRGERGVRERGAGIPGRPAGPPRRRGSGARTRLASRRGAAGELPHAGTG